MLNILCSTEFVEKYLGGQYTASTRNLRQTCKILSEQIAAPLCRTREQVMAHALRECNYILFSELKKDIDWKQVFIELYCRRKIIKNPLCDEVISLEPKKAVKAMSKFGLVDPELITTGKLHTIAVYTLTKYKHFDKVSTIIDEGDKMAFSRALGAYCDFEDIDRYERYVMPIEIAVGAVRHSRHEFFWAYFFARMAGANRMITLEWCLSDAIETLFYDFIDVYCRYSEGGASFVLDLSARLGNMTMYDYVQDKYFTNDGLLIRRPF